MPWYFYTHFWRCNVAAGRRQNKFEKSAEAYRKIWLDKDAAEPPAERRRPPPWMLWAVMWTVMFTRSLKQREGHGIISAEQILYRADLRLSEAKKILYANRAIPAEHSMAGGHGIITKESIIFRAAIKRTAYTKDKLLWMWFFLIVPIRGILTAIWKELKDME